MKRLHIIGAAALFTVLTAGGAAIAQTGSTTTPAEAGTCQVTVDRSQAADTFRVDKQRLENGDCVCYVYTGPTTQGAETEAKVTDVQNRRDCGAAPLADAAPVEAGSQFPIAAVAGTAGVIGIVAALAGSGGGDNNNDSTGG